MKKLINIFLLLTFLIGYLQWGKGNSVFIFQAEAELFLKGTDNFLSILHPFTIIPFCGQLLILLTLFQRQPGRIVSLIGLACLSTIMVLLFIIGVVTFNIKIAGSTIPFLITGIFVIRYNRKQ